jgi:hypothetical protein
MRRLAALGHSELDQVPQMMSELQRIRVEGVAHVRCARRLEELKGGSVLGLLGKGIDTLKKTWARAYKGRRRRAVAAR